MAKYDKGQLLADWRAGGYTQRTLADKHKVSASLVAKLTKGVDKDLLEIVSSKVKAEQDLAGKNTQEVIAVSEQVSKLTEDAKMIRLMSKNNMVGLGKKLTKHTDMSILEHKLAQETIDKASITLNVNARHAPPANIQQNTQNNNENITRVFHVVE